MKPKYRQKAKSCYMYTDNFLVHIKAEDITDITKFVETRFYTSNYGLWRPLTRGKNKKVIRLMKDELGRKIMTEFAALRPKTQGYLTDDIDENKNLKNSEKCVTKWKLTFKDNKHCLDATHLTQNKSNLKKINLM